MGSPVVVLLHGQPGSRLDWQLVLPLLEGLDVDAADRPGYDGTPAGGFFHGAERLFARLGERPAVLVGYSWGAGVALAGAAARPDLVSGLVLVSPVGSPQSVTLGDRLLVRPAPARAFGLGLRLVGRHLPGVAARAAGSRLGPAARQAVRADVRYRDPAAAWRAWRVEQRCLVTETPRLAELLGGIAAPAVVLGGTHDTVVPPAAARDLAHRLPAAQYREVAAGHLMPFEAPEAVADAVRDLLRRAAPADNTTS